MPGMAKKAPLFLPPPLKYQVKALCLAEGHTENKTAYFDPEKALLAT
jgi:hypothetical protein